MCVRLMLPGEKSIVTCPPDFAYDKFTRFVSTIILGSIFVMELLNSLMSATGQQMFLKELPFSGKLNYLDLKCPR